MVVMVIVAITLLVIVMVVMLVAFAFFVIMMVMMFMMLVTITLLMIVMIVMMVMFVMFVMLMAITFIVIVMVMLVMVFVMMTALGTYLFCCQFLEQMIERIRSFKCRYNRGYIQFIRRCGNKLGRCVMLSHERDCLAELCIGGLIGVAEKDTACMLDLIIKELAEILHIHLTFVDVHDYHGAVYHSTFKLRGSYRLCNVTELTYAGRLDDNSVGSIIRCNLFESLAKISNQ